MDILRKLFKLGESPPPATLSTNEEHYLESWPGYFLIAEVRDPQGRADDKATQILDNAGLSSIKHRRIHDFPNETELTIAKQIDNNGYRIPIRSITLVFGGLTAEELMQLERPLRDAWHQIKVLKTGNYSPAQAQANPIDKVRVTKLEVIRSQQGERCI